MLTTKQKAEKITLTIPFELKEQLVILKDELQISTSALYKEALESYIKEKEIGIVDKEILEEIHQTIAKTLNPKCNIETS